MAQRIEAAVRVRRGALEDPRIQTGLHDEIAKYARAMLYRETGDTLTRLRREVTVLMSRRYSPYAREAGIKSAWPILDAMGGAELVEKGSVLRGPVLRDLRRHSKANMAVFRARLKQELGTLGAEIEATFAEAYRDSKAKKQLISDLLESHRDELKRLRVVRGEIQVANEKLRRAEKRLIRASKRKQPRARRAVRQAKKELSKAKAKIRTTKDFYARFETRVQGHARDAIRREAEEGQRAAFKQAGYRTFTWIAVNGSDACPDCSARHGRTLTEAEAKSEGPGTGVTLCGSACQCVLAPKEYAEGNDTLASPLRIA